MTNRYKGINNYPIPFDKDGNQEHYPVTWYDGSHFKPNRVFGGSFTFKGYSRGRSAAYFDLENVTTKKKATMFLSDLSDAIPFIQRGYLNGTFCYAKKGANFGLKFLHEGEPNYDDVLEQFGPEGA